MICIPNLFSIAFLLSLIALTAPCVAQVFAGTNLSPDHSMYGTPPYVFERNRTISISFTTSPDVLRELVPEPLVPNGDGLMSLVINELHVVKPSEFTYNEALLSIPVSYGESVGRYLPILYLNKALGIVSGREIWGYSKIDADIEIVESEAEITARVVREGTTLMDVTFELGPVSLPLTALPDTRYFNLKAIPSAAADTPFDVKHITSSLMRDCEIQKLIPGKGQVTFGSSPTDPLGNIPVISIQDASFLVYNSVLDYDGILYDYLEEGK